MGPAARRSSADPRYVTLLHGGERRDGGELSDGEADFSGERTARRLASERPPFGGLQ